MPLVSFKKDKSLKDFVTDTHTPLMTALLERGIPVASSCHGDGVCSKCKIKIIDGQENLSPESSLEQELRNKNQISTEYRISCQTLVLGNITIDTDYW